MILTKKNGRGSATRGCSPPGGWVRWREKAPPPSQRRSGDPRTRWQPPTPSLHFAQSVSSIFIFQCFRRQGPFKKNKNKRRFCSETYSSLDGSGRQDVPWYEQITEQEGGSLHEGLLETHPSPRCALINHTPPESEWTVISIVFISALPTAHVPPFLHSVVLTACQPLHLTTDLVWNPFKSVYFYFLQGTRQHGPPLTRWKPVLTQSDPHSNQYPVSSWSI